jgi:hypothetical protein
MLSLYYVLLSLYYVHVISGPSTKQQNKVAPTPNANCNNFVPRCPIAANDTSIESSKQGLPVTFDGISIALSIAELEATRAEATQNYKITHTAQKHILAGDQST